jgi:hypothetical protein
VAHVANEQWVRSECRSGANFLPNNVVLWVILWGG